MILDRKFFKAMTKKQNIRLSFTEQEEKLLNLLNNKVQTGVKILHQNQAKLENYIEFTVVGMFIVGIANIVYGVLMDI